ncbi:MAG: winged helix-turn-helix transcriptional regulator [Thermoleophilia bacterium]|nr:winged helix-turn-helix transcriptional regulator [Thermoleophilia bacterium]
MSGAEDLQPGDDAASRKAVEAVDALSNPRFRAGEQVLTLLATPLNYMVLRVLAERPMRLAELRSASGLPAQTTLRGHLSSLGEIGVVNKRPTARMPYAVENELTPMGREILEVADHLGRWLRLAPGGPISLETGGARGVVKAFVDGWGSTMMRGLAAQPMSLTELDRDIAELSYPALERRLSSMRMAGLVEARPGPGGGTPYAVTDWARRGVVPLAAATNCERLHMRKRAAPVTQIDIEAAFMLATPLVGLSADASGSCRLEVEADPDQSRGEVGVLVAVEAGRVVACDNEPDPSPSAIASGSAARWFSAIKDGTAGLLRFGGARQLSEGLVNGLHVALLDP